MGSLERVQALRFTQTIPLAGAGFDSVVALAELSVVAAAVFADSAHFADAGGVVATGVEAPAAPCLATI